MSVATMSQELIVKRKRELAARLLREKAAAIAAEPIGAHRAIELQAARVPDRVAVVSATESLTYAELNARANRLARRLRSLGVGPEVLVGLCTGRSAAMVVGLLAILKAGGAYVPLDPTYPAERLRFMVEDAQLAILLTEERLRGQIPSSEARIICLDSQWEGNGEGCAGDVDGEARGSNLAYVIYTSGSTGRPKGVQVTHGRWRTCCSRCVGSWRSRRKTACWR